MEEVSWLEVSARLEPWPADVSPWLETFREFGVENTIETEPILSGCLVVTSGVDERADRLESALLAQGAASVTRRNFEEENWEENWKQFFRPRRVGERFVIKPTWESFDASSGDLVIELDPGRAFGTGDHPTTRLCLELLETVSVEGKRIADVGCGSGILAVGACMLGATEVVGSDIDPAAVEVARENASRSGFDIQFFIGAGFGPVVNLRDEAGGIWGEDEIDLQGKDLTSEQAVVGSDAAFDIVLSNIISMILIKLAEDAYRAIKPGGSWIVSGIIQQNWPDVLQKATEAGFSLIEMRGEDDWIGAHFRK